MMGERDKKMDDQRGLKTDIKKRKKKSEENQPANKGTDKVMRG